MNFEFDRERFLTEPMYRGLVSSALNSTYGKLPKRRVLVIGGPSIHLSKPIKDGMIEAGTEVTFGYEPTRIEYLDEDLTTTMLFKTKPDKSKPPKPNQRKRRKRERRNRRK